MATTPPLLPYLTVSDGAGAIAFYKNAFGAIEHELHLAPGSTKIMNACLSVNGGVFMLSDDFSAEFGGTSSTPEALHGSPVTLHLQVEDVDAGAVVTMPLADQFWGDRYGQLRDPFGHKWSMAQNKVSLTRSEIEEAAKTSFKI
jgi:PhnB protein